MIDSCYVPKLEVDLSQQQQLLDVLIVQKTTGKPPDNLPDGLDNLKQHNLLSYKSHQDSLDSWAIEELISYYVSYRKSIATREAPHAPKKMLPSDHFQLYGISARFPQGLFKAHKPTKIQAGVYEIQVLNNCVRILVLSKMPLTPNNALWHLFTGKPNQVAYGAAHYRWKQDSVSQLVNMIYERYGLEGIFMPYTTEQFFKDHAEHLSKTLTVEQKQKIMMTLPPEQRLEGIPSKQRLEGIPPEQRLEGISPEQRLEGIPPKQRLEGIPPEQRLEDIRPEDRLLGLEPAQLEQLMTTVQKLLKQQKDS